MVEDEAVDIGGGGGGSSGGDGEGSITHLFYSALVLIAKDIHYRRRANISRE